LPDTLTVHFCSQQADDAIILQWNASGLKIELTGQAVKVTFEGSTMTSDTLLTYEVNDITCVINTGDISASKIYINDTVSATTDSGTFTKTTNFLDLSLGGDGAQLGYLKIFPDYLASAADVANRFKTVYSEFLHWDFNGVAIGQAKCNVNRFVDRYNLSRKAQDIQTGSAGANRAGITFVNDITGLQGSFSDDQYGTYNPANGIYNGTTDERYLTDRFKAYIETWYLNNYEPMFIGRLDKSLLKRDKGADSLGKVSGSFADDITKIAETKLNDGFVYENYYLSDNVTPADSLLHQIIKKGSQNTVTNYCTNSAIDNAASWAVDGSDIVQTITFDNLSAGEYFTFSVNVVAAWSGDIVLIEADALGDNDSTTLAVAETLTGENKYSVTHKVTDSDSTKIIIKLTGYTAYSNFEEGQLEKAKVNSWFYVANTNLGTAGVADEADATTNTYQTLGIIAQTYLEQKRWHQQEPDQSLWESLKDISVASGGRYLGLQSNGVFRFDCALAEDTDPETIKTLDDTEAVATDLGNYKTNKLLVSGVNIIVYPTDVTVWNSLASGSFEDADYVVANGDTWPDPDEYGDFYAQYEV